jgi:hypothetical protein
MSVASLLAVTIVLFAVFQFWAAPATYGKAATPPGPEAFRRAGLQSTGSSPRSRGHFALRQGWRIERPRRQLNATKTHILHSALSRWPGNYPPLPTVNDFAQFSVQRYYFDVATSKSLALEPMLFRERRALRRD